MNAKLSDWFHSSRLWSAIIAIMENKYALWDLAQRAHYDVGVSIKRMLIGTSRA